MDFFDILKTRRACHHFLANKKIPKETLEQIVDATRLAPSGYNAQPWKCIFIEDKEQKRKIQELAYNQEHVTEASALMLMVGDTKIVRDPDALLADWLKYGYCTEDKIPSYKNTFTKPRSPEKLKSMALRNGAMAAMTFIYSAENLGIATCPMMGFSQLKIKKLLNIPEDYIPILLVAMGYRDEGKEKERLPRKPIEDFISWETFT